MKHNQWNKTTTSLKHVQQANLWPRLWPNNNIRTDKITRATQRENGIIVEEQQKKKTHRNEIAGVIDINRMFSVAPQVCTTLSTSRNTVHNEIHPDEKRNQTHAASDINRIWWDRRAHNSTRKIPYKTQDTQLLFILCYCCRWVLYNHTHNLCKRSQYLTDSRPKQLQMSLQRPTVFGPRPIFLSSRIKTPGTNTHLLAGVRSWLTHLPHHMQSRLYRWFLSHPRRTYAVLREHMFGERHKNTTKWNSEVVNCNRLFPLAQQDCTTLATSRKTVRNGSYPENSKRKLQPASTECDGIGAHTTQNAKVPTKTLQHNSCFHVVFLLPLGTTSGSSKNCACALDNELTRYRNNCKCRSTSSNCKWWNLSHKFSRSRVLTLGTNAHLHLGVLSQLTHLPHHTQSRLGALCPINDELTLFSTIKNLKKSKKTQFWCHWLQSYIYIYILIRALKLQISLNHATLFAKRMHPETPNAPATTSKNFIE